MLVTLVWKVVSEGSDLWDCRRVIYGYFTVGDDELLYIGKAYRKTVRERWTRSAKEEFWNDLERERGIKEHVVRVGDLSLDDGRRISGELLTDVESLLIKRLCPWGNVQGQSSRIARPGLRVLCEGNWPFERSEFRDIG